MIQHQAQFAAGLRDLLQLLRSAEREDGGGRADVAPLDRYRDAWPGHVVEGRVDLGCAAWRHLSRPSGILAADRAGGGNAAVITISA